MKPICFKNMDRIMITARCAWYKSRIQQLFHLRMNYCYR